MDNDPASIAHDLLKQQTGRAALGFDPVPVFKGFGAKPDLPAEVAPSAQEDTDGSA